MEVHGSLWKLMDGKGSQSKSIDVNRRKWNCMEAKGNKRKQKDAKIDAKGSKWNQVEGLMWK
jgi:hypothetical protein